MAGTNAVEKQDTIMHNLIPSFIAEKNKDEKFSGSLRVATMFIDISGFTAMTQSLMVNGKEGTYPCFGDT